MEPKLWCCLYSLLPFPCSMSLYYPLLVMIKMANPCDGKAIGSGSEGANSSLQEQFNKSTAGRLYVEVTVMLMVTGENCSSGAQVTESEKEKD
ncbi:hypothetical protein MKW98_002845 [Papaver atlanticum]|uniref:Uncharacterized protein n=1 Tax=Papaver atlanticum TaxID=357466 RepID=A0AAD4XM33_9MAGN|nr:hypothetical protein MKW98_002845 [Papaver atlanticum]